jgi:phosphate-selective porin
VGARFDYFDEDVHTSAREFNYTIGATYQPLKYLRLQLNYALKHYPNQDRPLANLLSVMVSGIF